MYPKTFVSRPLPFLPKRKVGKEIGYFSLGFFSILGISAFAYTVNGLALNKPAKPLTKHQTAQILTAADVAAKFRSKGNLEPSTKSAQSSQEQRLTDKSFHVEEIEWDPKSSR